MLIHIIVIIIYLSFVFDLVIWPIPSEASTSTLITFDDLKSATMSVLLIMVFILNLTFFMLPLFISVHNIIYDVEPKHVRSIVGLIVSGLGRVISLKATLTLRHSHNNKLITQSIFKFSRNPISTGMHFTIIGLILVLNDWYLWIGFVLYFINIHLKIRIEEKNLIEIYGHAYQLYKSKTPRYLVW